MAANLEGRVCIVTGPTSGIGKETARGLARMGASVILACRDMEKGEVVRREIAADAGNSRLEVAKLDLADQSSIRAFAADFQKTHLRLHVLINNAGISALKRRLTPDGVESQFAVNVLGPFLLTNLLLGTLKDSAPARIINVGSAAHAGGHVDFDNLQGEREFRSFRAYSNSKLGLLLITYELARRLQGTGVTVNCVHPGVIRSNLGGDDLPGALIFFKLFMRGPVAGAQPSLRLASAPELEGVTGKYFHKLKEARSAPESYDTAAAQRLWDVAARLTKLDT